jgi:hypothetical protein
VAVLFLLGTFPTAWIGPDPNSEPPPKEATSIHELDAEQIAGLLKRGRELIAAGDVSMARLVLKRAADAGNPSAALELGATYDPFVIRELTDPTPFERVAKLIGGAPHHDSDEAVIPMVGVSRMAGVFGGGRFCFRPVDCSRYRESR